VPPEGFETRPDFYWCWDDESAAVINAWTTVAQIGQRAFVGGNAFADRWRTGVGGLARDVDAEIVCRKAAVAGMSHHILVSLDSMGDVVPARIALALDMAPRDWCFWLRLHPVNQPGQGRALRDTLRGRNWRVLDWRFTSEAPLPALLRHVDAHLTVSRSSVVKDALVEGVPSVACDEEARQFFPSEIRSGMLRVASSPDGILGALAAQMEQRYRLPNDGGDRGAAAVRLLRQYCDRGFSFKHKVGSPGAGAR
jgi:hypothetical protein